jgi:hypothetical protein
MIQRTIRRVLTMRWQEGKRGTCQRNNEAIQIHAKHETGPTHAQLVRMTRRRGYTTVSAQLDHDPTKYYPCSTPLSRYHTRQTAFDRQPPDLYLDALDGHGSILEIDMEDMPSDNSGISDISAFSATLDILASPATSATSALW